MRMISTALVASGLALSALPAAASAKEEAAANPSDRVVCKYRPQTGTRFKTKICKSAGEWDRIAEESRRAASETINAPKPNPVSNPG